MINDLIDDIENTFGKYKTGMKKAIINKLSNIDESSAKILLRVLTEDYDMGRPPSLKIIMGEIYKHGIPILTQGYGGMSVCEHCNFEYDEDLVRCPECNKLRIHGKIKLYKMGEGRMHPVEIQERKEKREAMEPSAEEVRKFNEFLAETGGLKALTREKIKNLRRLRQNKGA